MTTFCCLGLIIADAVTRGYEEITRLLLQNNDTDINMAGKYGCTALLFSVILGSGDAGSNKTTPATTPYRHQFKGNPSKDSTYVID